MTSFVGQEAQMKAFLAASASARMHHGWILAGIRGLGKARFARAAATHLLAEAAGPPLGGEGFYVPAGHRIRSLMEAGAHPDFICLTRLEPETTGELARNIRSEEHTSELQSLMRKSYAVF